MRKLSAELRFLRSVRTLESKNPHLPADPRGGNVQCGERRRGTRFPPFRNRNLRNQSRSGTRSRRDLQGDPHDPQRSADPPLRLARHHDRRRHAPAQRSRTQPLPSQSRSLAELLPGNLHDASLFLAARNRSDSEKGRLHRLFRRHHRHRRISGTARRTAGNDPFTGSEFGSAELPQSDPRNAAGRRTRNYALGLPSRDCRGASHDA